MERWIEVYKGKIPKGKYQTQITNGELDGLVIRLSNTVNEVILKFGFVYAVQMLDEGIVQDMLYSDEAIEYLKKNHFENVIYEVMDGEFETQIQRYMGRYAEIFDLKHYVVITQNFNIDIITECEPEIVINLI